MSRPRVKVTSNHRRSIVSRYGKGQGFEMIERALKFVYSISVIRRVLTEEDVKIRGRGRPALV